MLNNCVGKANRPAVISYLAVTSTLLMLMALTTLFHLTSAVKDYNEYLDID